MRTTFLHHHNLLPQLGGGYQSLGDSYSVGGGYMPNAGGGFGSQGLVNQSPGTSGPKVHHYIPATCNVIYVPIETAKEPIDSPSDVSTTPDGYSTGKWR